MNEASIEELKQLASLVRNGQLFEVQVWLKSGKPFRTTARNKVSPILDSVHWIPQHGRSVTNGPVETEERSFRYYPWMASSFGIPVVNTAFCVCDELNPRYLVVWWSKARYLVLGGTVVKRVKRVSS
jgi:hypothetical protein